MADSQITPVSWAEQSLLTSLEQDCVTAVVLKILDNKCKMPTDQQEAVLAIYEVLHQQEGGLFDPKVHACIEEALREERLSQAVNERIHQYRLEAEEKISKPEMKTFKSKLHKELFDPLAK